jgi:hypothetical protein
MQKYIKYCSFKKVKFSSGKFFSVMFCVLSIFGGIISVNANAASQTQSRSNTDIQQTKAVVNPQLPNAPDNADSKNKNHLDTKKIQNFESLGIFKEWEAFAMITQDEAVCWVASSNREAKKDDKVNEKTSSIILSIRLDNQERDEFSYHSVHHLEPEEKLNMTIDNVVGFKLSPQEHWAWLKSSIDESRFVLAAKKGTQLVLSGKTTHDKRFRETYSLSGFTTAYKSAFDACSKAIQVEKK